MEERAYEWTPERAHIVKERINKHKRTKERTNEIMIDRKNELVSKKMNGRTNEHTIKLTSY